MILLSPGQNEDFSQWCNQKQNFANCLVSNNGEQDGKFLNGAYKTQNTTPFSSYNLAFIIKINRLILLNTSFIHIDLQLTEMMLITTMLYS